MIANSHLEMTFLSNCGFELPHVYRFLRSPALPPPWGTYCLMHRQYIFLLNVIIISYYSLEP